MNEVSHVHTVNSPKELGSEKEEVNINNNRILFICTESMGSLK